MYEFFSNIFHSMLAAYRPKTGCHHVLLKLIEDAKKALDRKEHVGAVLLDLSKAFDAILRCAKYKHMCVYSFFRKSTPKVRLLESGAFIYN